MIDATRYSESDSDEHYGTRNLSGGGIRKRASVVFCRILVTTQREREREKETRKRSCVRLRGGTEAICTDNLVNQCWVCKAT